MISSLWNRLSSTVPTATKIIASPHVAYVPSLNFERFASLLQMHRVGPYKPKKVKKNRLDGQPLAKGIIIQTLIKKPKKPNSANRKCVLVRLPSGKERLAYVPGEGHNLQEHNAVLVNNRKLRDVPGVHLTCIRGAYDLPHVKK